MTTLIALFCCFENELKKIRVLCRNFISIYKINRTLHGRLGIRILSFRAESMYTFFLLPVGPIYVSISVSKINDVAKEISYEFNGWVRNGGRWKPTECQARVEVPKWRCYWGVRTSAITQMTQNQRLKDTEQCPHHRTPTHLWQVLRSVFPCTSFEVPPFLLEVSRKKYVDVW